MAKKKHKDYSHEMIKKRKITDYDLDRVQFIVKSIRPSGPSRDRFESRFSKISDLSDSEEDNFNYDDPLWEITNKFVTECGCSSILVVDDQIINRMILNEFGRKLGILSDEAEDGKEAYHMYLKSLQRPCCEGYKLILMDLNMPVMDGIRSSHKILEHLTNKPKPQIVAVTAFVSDEEKEKCESVGMKEVMHKPISSETYKSILMNY